MDKIIEQIMADYKVSEGLAKTIYKDIKKTADAGLITDFNRIFKATIDKDTGFLTAPVTLARTGVQYYYGFELGLPERALDKIGVFRSPEEVFHPDSIASFINLTVTDDHPSEAVNTDNVKALQVGSVSEVKRDGDFLVGIATITDKSQITKAQEGKVEDSVGYSNDLTPLVGEFSGDKYEFVQTNIVANHLAIVDAGRCGPACKLTIDHKKKEKTMIIVTVDGISFHVEDEQLGQAILKEQKAHDAEKEVMKKKEEEDEEEKGKLKKEKSKAEADKDAALKTVLSDADIDVMVNDRAELFSTAKRILGDKMPECINCGKELKTAVIDHVLGLGIKDWSKKDMAYVDASYDHAIAQEKKVATSLGKVADELLEKDEEGNVITRDTAAANYQEKFLGLLKRRV